MNLIPTLIDGATVIVFKLEDRVVEYNHELCERLVVQFHNWIRDIEIEYLVFDLEEEKSISHHFILELMKLRKRFEGPFLFAGVDDQGKKTIESYGYNKEYPFFLTAEDAVRALRIQCPGITETKINGNLKYNVGILNYSDEENNLKNIKCAYFS